MDEEQKKLAEEFLFSGDHLPSFAKMLYFGSFDTKRVHPYPLPSDSERSETDALIAKLKTFASEHIDPKVIDQNSQIPEKVISGLADMGILGMTIPKEYGGLGRSQYAYCRVTEELAGICGSTALFVNAHQSVGLKALLLFGTDQQKKRWLKPLTEGKQIAAFSLTEPNAGSDAAGIETRAVYDPQKKVYRLNGQKQWTTNGSIASILTVMAKTEDDKITAFLVTPDMPGFKIKDKALEKVGMRGTWTSNLIFDNVEVPEENILGPKGKGLRVCLTVLDYGRTTFGATCTGTAKKLLELATTYAGKRHQFGKPLSHFPLIKKKLARIASDTYAMEATTYLTAGILDRGEEDIMLEAAILKVFASEALWNIVYETMQIYGGKSFFTDEPLERIMRDARLNMIGEGANEVLRAFIAAVGMRDVGMQLKEGLDSLKKLFSHPSSVWRFCKTLLARFQTPKLPYSSTQAKRLSRVIKHFGQTVIRLLAKHGETIIDQQLILDRVASIAISLYTTTAVLGKLEASPNPTMKEMLTANHYCNRSLDMAERLFKGLSRNRDGEIEELADSL